MRVRLTWVSPDLLHDYDGDDRLVEMAAEAREIGVAYAIEFDEDRVEDPDFALFLAGGVAAALAGLCRGLVVSWEPGAPSALTPCTAHDFQDRWMATRWSQSGHDDWPNIVEDIQQRFTWIRRTPEDLARDHVADLTGRVVRQLADAPFVSSSELERLTRQALTAVDRLDLASRNPDLSAFTAALLREVAAAELDDRDLVTISMAALASLRRMADL